MKPASAKPNYRVLIFFDVMAASLAVLQLLPPIPQDQRYHEFSDQRALLGIPNFWNVRLEPAVHCGWSRGAAAVSSRSGDLRDLSGHIPDRFRVVLLPLASERQHAVLGPTAHDPLFHGHSGRSGRGACQCKAWGYLALAAARNRHIQPAVVAL